MTTEEKAKAYDEAIERAKEYFNSPRTCFDIEQLCNVFPELKESEDEKIRKELIFYLRHQHSISENFEDIGKWIVWLEKQAQKHTEWSEEDEKIIIQIKKALEDFFSASETDKIKYWLNFLKDRVHPQNTWKPSDEQMNALWSATEKYLESDNENVRKLRGEVLESLYEDLKKLKG